MLGVGAPAPAGTPSILPLSEVRPGMMATVHTVFEGSAVEEFPAEILAVMENFLGPRQDLILARLKGPKVEFTGVVAGMSGSPVYVDGRLVGALSYRMGQFSKEPIAGITPIEYMLALPRGAAEAAAPSRAEAPAAPAPLTPIEVPVMVSGVPPAALKLYEGELSKLGLRDFMAGGAAAGGTAQSGAVAGLKGGDPVAAALVTGDITVAVTGTVTLVDGNRVYAFGHPSVLRGAAEMPMARAEIYTTLASLSGSTKLSHVLGTIGTFNESRLPGIAGEIGPSPGMLPVNLKVTDPAGVVTSYHYELARHRDLSPALLGLVTASTLFNVPGFAGEMSYALSGVIDIEGHEDIMLGDLYSGFTEQDSGAGVLATDVQSYFAAVWQNRFTEAPVRSVDLTISTVEKSRLCLVDGVYPSRKQVRPGETAEYRVLLRTYRGEPITRTFRYEVPEGEPVGPLTVSVGGSNVLAAAERAVLSRQVAQVDSLDQLITLINGLRTSDKLYFKVTRRAAGAVVQSEVMPALPPSVATTLSSGRGTGEVTPLPDTIIHEESLGMDLIVVGGTTLSLTVIR